MSKDVFPSLLKKLYALLYPTEEQKSESMKSGFKKCGICPFNEEIVLSRLPDGNTDTGFGTPVRHKVSAAVIDMLADMRGVNKDVEIRRRRKKINVAPGKSIGLEDLNEPMRSASTSSAGAAVVDTSTGTGIDNASDVEPDSDVPVNDSDTDTGTSTSAHNDRSGEETDTSTGTNTAQGRQRDTPLSVCHKVPVKIQPKVGKFYIVQFETGKQVIKYKHYVAKMLHIARREYEMTFARRATRASLIFSWPSVVDKSYVEFKQLKCELTLQKQDRRGRLVFPSSQLELYKNSLQ